MTIFFLELLSRYKSLKLNIIGFKHDFYLKNKKKNERGKS